jgi:putative hydrolase of the HAD superfamily
MTTDPNAIIRAHCPPREPLPTGATPRLQPLAGIGAVLFDIYGTLLISAAGEIGGGDAATRAAAVRDAFAATAHDGEIPATVAAAALVLTIQQSQERSRAAGIEDPEVDILDVWKQTLTRLIGSGLLAPAVERIDIVRLALEYEVRTNPVWPMPNLRECLDGLRARGLPLGIISNAQCFTRKLFPALLGQTLKELGFDAGLQWYSYRCGHAKPGAWMFQQARAACGQRGLVAAEVLYVGFRTALFAGDARSYRPRPDDPRLAYVVPDLVLTDLRQLPTCLESRP